jgi:very-short-patch-repair endonuclease
MIRLAPGVFRMRDHPANWESRLWAALIEAGEGAVVGIRSAARLHGLWRYRDTDVDEIVKKRGSNHKASLGRLCETSLLDPDHVVTVDGFPATSLARTIFDLLGDPDHRPLRSEAARRWHEDRMMAVVNDAMRYHGLTVLVELFVLASIGRRGRSGTALVRTMFSALASDYVSDESNVESAFSALLARSDLPSPEKQVPMHDGEGFVGRVDFLWPDERVIVEIDSRLHDGPVDRRSDERRDDRLRALGYEVLRFRWTDLVTTSTKVLRCVRRALLAATMR